MDTQQNIQPQGVPEQPKAKWYKNKKWIALIVALLVTASLIVSYFIFNRDADAPSAAKTSTQTESDSDEIPLAINPIDETKIPLGDNKVSTEAKQGYIFSCQTSFNGGGASDSNSWIDTANNTWDATKKVSVSGAVEWPNASYEASVSGGTRTITGNNLPINGQTTGVYPVQSSDPAYQYDKNPNEIAEQSLSLSFPATPSNADSPSCVDMGAVGVLMDGVVLFNGLDAGGRDAAAYETLDSCDGHPEMTDEYHHHGVPSCILSKYNEPSTSTLVGYAYDGYGIYVERDKNGDLLTNENLDECHGHTSIVDWDGEKVKLYHYVATMEYPYVVGCFRATPQVMSTQTASLPERQTPPLRR
ncbi:YHYH protein [Candidatus Saccharibacteria bacterium]|nr:YHYH protein [Candidatus Saccharibacteria bacterium]